MIKICINSVLLLYLCHRVTKFMCGKFCKRYDADKILLKCGANTRS